MSSRPSRARPSTSDGSSSARVARLSASTTARSLSRPNLRAVCPRHRPASPSSWLPAAALVPTSIQQCSMNARSSSFKAMPTSAAAAGTSSALSWSAPSTASATTSWGSAGGFSNVQWECVTQGGYAAHLDSQREALSPTSGRMGRRLSDAALDQPEPLPGGRRCGPCRTGTDRRGVALLAQAHPRGHGYESAGGSTFA